MHVAYTWLGVLFYGTFYVIGYFYVMFSCSTILNIFIFLLFMELSVVHIHIYTTLTVL